MAGGGVMGDPRAYTGLLGALGLNETWGENAACHGKAELLENPDLEAEAKTLCLGSRIDGIPRCPVIDECTRWVLPLRRHKDPGGVRAGMNESERNRARRRRKPTPPKVIAVIKRCGDCEEVKSGDEFYMNTSHTDGLSTRCRSCACDRAKILRQEKRAV
jgi:hypothetical protein